MPLLMSRLINAVNNKKRDIMNLSKHLKAF